MSILSARHAWAFALLVLYSAAGCAEGILASELGRLTLDEAIARSLRANPQLVASGAQLDAARGRVVQAHLAPNPELTVELEDFLGNDNFSAFDSAQTTISLSWIIERRVRARRVDAALAGESLLAVDVDIQRMDVAAETARRFISMLANQARKSTATDAVKLAEETIQTVIRRVEAGRTPPADLARAEARLATARLVREDLDHELAVSRHRLAAQWGQTAPEFVEVHGDPLTLPQAEPFEVLRERMLQTDDINRYLSAQRLAESELRLAQAQSRPVWRASLGIRRFENTDDHSLLGSITLPLTIRNRNQGRIAETVAKIDQVRAEGTVAQIQLETKLYVLYEALQHSLHRAQTLSKEVMPRIESALSQTRAAYERGRYSYLELGTVQAELIDARGELIEASITAHEHVIEIERLTGARAVQMEELK